MRASWVKLPIKHKILVFTPGLLLICWLYYTYVVAVQEQEIARLTAKLRDKTQQLTVIQVFARTYPDPAAYLAEFRKKSAKTEAMLPNHHDLSGLLAQVEQIAKACGLQLVEIKPVLPLNKTSYVEVPLEIRCRGSFTQTKDFLKQLENIPRFNLINHLSINSRQGELDSKLVLIVYSYATSAGSAGDKQTLPGNNDEK